LVYNVLIYATFSERHAEFGPNDASPLREKQN